MVRKAKDKVGVTGPWTAFPMELVKSRAFAQLSPHANKLFFDLFAQMGAGGFRNGDITATPDVMAVRGWPSKATLRCAIKELEAANLLIKTRQGNKRKCSLYALTPWPLHCDLDKLDVKPGCYTTADWTTNGEFKPPTEENPVTWNRARKNDSSTPVAGHQSGNIAPPRVISKGLHGSYCPATGH